MMINWAAFNNIRMLEMACMPVVIFYLIWLINTSEMIRCQEGSLLDLVSWPDGNAIPVLIMSSAVVTVFIELYGLMQFFKAGNPKSESNVTNSLLYYITGIIIMVIVFLTIIFYAGLQTTIFKAKIKDGIAKAMLRYSSHLPSKIAIDRLQTRFQCCGQVTFVEWFYIPWTSGEIIDSKKPKSFISDDVPYSCCSVDAMFPCIHHDIMQPSVIYKYDPQKQMTIWLDGCENKLIQEMGKIVKKFITVMGLILLAMLFQCMGARFLHTAYKNGLHCGNQINCEAYILKSSRETSRYILKIQSFKSRFRKNKSKDARIIEWVASTSYHRCNEDSSSDGSDTTKLDTDHTDSFTSLTDVKGFF